MANRKATEPVAPVAIGGNSGAELKHYLERIETLADEKAALGQDIRDIFTEAKLKGFDPKIMRIIVRRRAMDAVARAEQDALVETYSHAVGLASPADAEAE